MPRARGRSDRLRRRRASPMGMARWGRGRLRGFEVRPEPTPPCVAAEERSPRPDRARGGRSCRGASRTRQKRPPAAPPSQPDGHGAVGPWPVERVRGATGAHATVRCGGREEPATRSGARRKELPRCLAHAAEATARGAAEPARWAWRGGAVAGSGSSPPPGAAKARRLEWLGAAYLRARGSSLRPSRARHTCVDDRPSGRTSSRRLSALRLRWQGFLALRAGTHRLLGVMAPSRGPPALPSRAWSGRAAVSGLCTGAARRPRARSGTLGCSGSRSGRRQPCMRATAPYAAQAPPSNRTTGRRLLSQRGQSSPGARRSSARRRRILTDRRWTLGGSFGSSHPLFARGRGSSPPVGRRSNGARAGNRTTATAHAARPTARTRVDALPRHCAQVESSERESES